MRENVFLVHVQQVHSFLFYALHNAASPHRSRENVNDTAQLSVVHPCICARVRVRVFLRVNAPCTHHHSVWKGGNALDCRHDMSDTVLL